MSRLLFSFPTGALNPQVTPVPNPCLEDLLMTEQLRVRGAPTVRRQLRSIHNRALACRRLLGTLPGQDRRCWEAVDDVLRTIIALCEHGCRCEAAEAIRVAELVEDLWSSTDFDN